MRRIYAGVHTRFDHLAGLQLVRRGGLRPEELAAARVPQLRQVRHRRGAGRPARARSRRPRFDTTT